MTSYSVIPAQAGIQGSDSGFDMDPRLRGDDGFGKKK